jgi:hypothetical protein
MPHTHTFIGEGLAHGSGDLDQSVYQCSARLRIKLPYIVNMCPRHDQHVSRIVLTRIDKGDAKSILVNNICRRVPRHDLAEDALGDHGLSA